MKKIGERVASVRGTLGVSAFADAIGVNRKTIQRWEDGLAIPDGNSLLLLLEKFGVDPSWLLTGKAVAPMRAEESRAPYGISISAADEVALIQGYREIEPQARVALQNLLMVIAGAAPVANERPARIKIHSGDLPVDTRTIEQRIKVRSGELPPSEFKPPRKRGGGK